MTIRACAAAVLAAGLFPATAGAATVSVVEETLSQSPPHERATLAFEAAPGEANLLRIERSGTEQGKARYDLRDDGAAISAGAGCSGGEAPAAVVSCLVPPSRPAECNRLFCSDRGREVRLTFALGDGDDILIASTLPAGDGGGGVMLVEAAAGDGADQLYSGPTSDAVDPGPGADTVKTRQGDDFADAGPAPDGPDFFELGDGFDTVSYADRGESVTVTLAGGPDDGAAGEGDDVEAEKVIGGPAADSLTGGDGRLKGPEGYAEMLIGGSGGDRLVGGRGADLLYAASLGLQIAAGGHDLLRGGRGRDVIQAFGGDDEAYGGAGNDGLFMSDGDDLGSGGGGNDSVNGEDGSDRLRGGTHRDRLDGGSAGDAGDGDADRLACGPSAHDHAFSVEPADRTRRCELIFEAA